MYEEIYAQAKQACNELCDVAKLKEGSIVVTVRQLASNTKISKIIELFFKRGCRRNYRTQFKS